MGRKFFKKSPGITWKNNKGCMSKSEKYLQLQATKNNSENLVSMANHWKKLKQPSYGYILEWKNSSTPLINSKLLATFLMVIAKSFSLPFCNEEDRMIREF